MFNSPLLPWKTNSWGTSSPSVRYTFSIFCRRTSLPDDCSVTEALLVIRGLWVMVMHCGLLESVSDVLGFAPWSPSKRGAWAKERLPTGDVIAPT